MKYLYIGIFACLIITLLVIIILLFRSSDKKQTNLAELTELDDGKGLEIEYVKSEEFKKNIKENTGTGDINSQEAKGSSFTGPVTPAPMLTPSQKPDKDLTPVELAQKYTYPELVAKFGDEKLKAIFGESKINEFKEIPNKQTFPKTKFLIKHDFNKVLCLNDRGTTKPGEFKLNFAECDKNNPNQQFIYEPYRKYIKSANKNLCLDNGDEHTNYIPNQLYGKNYYFSLQECNPTTHRQRFYYNDQRKLLQNADRPEWVLTNPGMNDLYSKNIAFNQENTDSIYPRQKMILEPI